VVILVRIILWAVAYGGRPTGAADVGQLDLGPETVVTANQLVRPDANNSPMVAVDHRATLQSILPIFNPGDATLIALELTPGSLLGSSARSGIQTGSSMT